MELWAAGFNAWAQFHFDTPVPVDPVDLPNFTSILEDDSIEVLALSESAIAGKPFISGLLSLPSLESSIWIKNMSTISRDGNEPVSHLMLSAFWLIHECNEMSFGGPDYHYATPFFHRTVRMRPSSSRSVRSLDRLIPLSSTPFKICTIHNIRYTFSQSLKPT